jgi:hypothetical protein
MALVILEKSECPLCGKVLRQGESLVMTSPFIEERTHPLWRFSDAAMHRACFLAWSERPLFIETFNSYFDRHLRGMRYMLEDGSIEEREPRTFND